MTQYVANRVQETALASGLANLTLQGAVTGWRAFADAIPVGGTTIYCVVDGEAWEVGIGTLVSASELSRDTIIDSSATADRVNNVEVGTPVKLSLSSGTHTVICTLEVGNMIFKTADGSLADPTPFRATVFVETIAAMKALNGLEDNETVIVKAGATAGDGLGGIFYFDADDATSPDNTDTFRNDNYGTGLHKRVRLSRTDLLSKDGGTMTGFITLHADPSSALHPATKQYVDSVATGLDVKPSVKAATTASITLSGEQTVDGVALVAGDRCLVKNQGSPSANGIYVVAAGSWTRATDMDAWSEVPGAFCFVEQGTTNADTGWVATADAGGTLGSTSITFGQFSGSGAYQPINTQLTAATAAWADIASASTVNIGAATTERLRVTGTTAITAFDTAASGVRRTLRFAGILTLTHNATSLILGSGGANVETEAGDTAVFESLGSGNWILISYKTASGKTPDSVYRVPKIIFDNTTDRTTVLQAILDGGYSRVRLPRGSAIITQLLPPNDIIIEGPGRGRCNLKRKDSTGAITSVIYATGKHGITLRGFTVDGNKGNQTNAATNIVFESCYDIHVEKIETKSAKAVGGSYGGGFTFADNADAANGTESSFDDILNRGNDTYQGVVARCTAVNINRHKSSGAANAGLSIQDFTLPVPGSPTNKQIRVTNCSDVGSPIGLEIFGFRSGQASGQDIASAEDFVSKGLVVTNWHAKDCSIYGLAAQADHIAIVTPIIEDCGSDLSNGGLLFNCGHSTLLSPNVDGSYYFGIDMGGMYLSQVVDPIVTRTGLAVNKCIAINAGGARWSKIVGGALDDNGGDGSGGAYNIMANRYDGPSATNWFGWSGEGLEIAGVTVHIRGSSVVGIAVLQGFEAADVHDNLVVLHAAGTPYIAQGNPATSRWKGNRRYTPSTLAREPTVASATTIVLADGAEDINITGSATIQSIHSKSQSDLEGKLFFIYATTLGTGYDPASDTISIAGGSGATATPVITAAGVLVGAYVTSGGDGSLNPLSPPAVTVNTSTGSGAVLVAVVGAAAPHKSKVRLFFGGASVLDDVAVNVYLRNGDFTPSAFGVSVLELTTQFGNYYET